MPQQAFADMWATLKGGEPWSALIKNRRKDGDHYWVRANAIPVLRNGQTSGYRSVRTKPSREATKTAESLYRAFREHKASKRRFHKGLIVRTGLMGWTSILKTMPVRRRIRSALLAAAPFLLCAAWLCGVREISLVAGFSAFALGCLLC
ncbi:hypothetical protein QFZ94_001338 [Paraburkholderia sp. JPY465]